MTPKPRHWHPASSAKKSSSSMKCRCSAGTCSTSSTRTCVSFPSTSQNWRPPCGKLSEKISDPRIPQQISRCVLHSREKEQHLPSTSGESRTAFPSTSCETSSQAYAIPIFPSVASASSAPEISSNFPPSRRVSSTIPPTTSPTPTSAEASSPHPASCSANPSATSTKSSRTRSSE